MTTEERLKAFEDLQLSLVLGTDFNQDSMVDALMNDPASLESYSTFYRALMKSKIEANQLLNVAATLTLQTDTAYLMYVGLALRFGANPNTYVDGTYNINDVDTEIPIHLVKYLWDMVPLSEDELAEGQQVFNSADHPILDILAMMMLSGLDPNAQVSTPEVLLDAGIDATKFIAEQPDFGYTLYEVFESDDELILSVGELLRYYEGARGNLQLAYGVDEIRDEKLLAYAFHLDLPAILSLNNVYADIDNYRKLIFFQDTKSLNKLVPTLKQLGIIGNSPLENSIENLVLTWTVKYYAWDIMLMLLDAGVRIGPEIKDLTIELARATCEPYPVQCQLLNRMIVEYVRRGNFFDQAQLNQVAAYSPITHDAISQLSLSSVVTTITKKTPQARLLLADRDLPSIGNGTIDDQYGNQSPRAMYNQPPIRTYTSNLPMTSTYVGSSAPTCANLGSLPRPIQDYAIVDRVVYSDGQLTWCFTSDVYPELLKTGTNPWATSPNGQPGVRIPPEVMIEIAQKFDAIKCNRLVSGDIDRESLERRNVEELYRFAEQYGIDRERFYRLTSRDFQQFSDAILDPQTRVVIDQSNPIIAIRDFARAILRAAEKSPDRIGQLLAAIIP